MIIPISDKFNDYANRILNQFKEQNIRIKIDTRNEKMGAKIRNAELNKIPIMIIIGENEVKDKSISVRRRFLGNKNGINTDEYLESLLLEIKNRDKLQGSKK